MSEPGDATDMKRRSRRNFLKASATAVSAAATGSLAISRSAHAAGDDTLKVGLIGCGGRGAGAAVNAMNADPGVRLIAMADIFEDRVHAKRKLLQEKMPDQTAVDDDLCFVGFDGYQKVIESGVDLVLIACTSGFHPKYLKACVDAGKHVFVEKPHAIDPPGVHTVIAACEDAKKKNLSVASGLMRRYNHGMRETMKRVFDGAIGEIVAIHQCHLRNPYGLIQRRPEDSEIEYQYRNWYHFNWLSGDDVVQTLVHNVDTAAWAMREEPPLTAYGLGGRSSSFGGIYGNVFDHHSIVYEYANGVRMYGFCRTQLACYGESSSIFLGTKGRCDLTRQRIEGETDWRYQAPRRTLSTGSEQRAKGVERAYGWSPSTAAAWGSAYDVEHRELFAAIRDGKPINDGLHMARSTMIAILGQIACYTGKQVTWEDALNAEFTFGRKHCDFSTEPPVKPDASGIYPVAVPGVTKLI